MITTTFFDKICVVSFFNNLMKDKIIAKLRARFNPHRLEVIDESHNHANHNELAKAGGTHFKLIIGAQALYDKSQIEAHRMIYDCLSEELSSGLHALAITIKNDFH